MYDIWYNTIGKEGVILQNTLGIIAGIFVAFAYVWYCRGIFKGTTKPNRMTWFIIAVVSWLLLLTSRDLGASTTIWALIGEAVVVSVVALMSIKRGVGGWDKRDKMALIGATVSFILWRIFESSLMGLIGALLVDTFALWPTVQKSFEDPGSEDRPAWTMTQIGNVFNILAINQLVVGVWLYPVWRFVLDGIVMYALYRKRK